MANNQDNRNTAEQERYNGWTNYETWAVSLWIDNHQATYDYWLRETIRQYNEAEDDEMVRRGLWTADQAARYNLARQLKDEIINAAPDLGATLYSDLLTAAFNKVNWTEIAESRLESFSD